MLESEQIRQQIAAGAGIFTAAQIAALEAELAAALAKEAPPAESAEIAQLRAQIVAAEGVLSAEQVDALKTNLNDLLLPVETEPAA